MNNVKENYNSLSYWENVLIKNKGKRANMFMQKPPTEKSIYFHTMIFGQKNGINNVWGYCPNIKCLVGYIQYLFLQEAFYKWINGKDKFISQIPCVTVDKISREGEKAKKISKEIAINMRSDYEFFNRLWIIPSDRIEMELKRFLIDFNKRWMGNNKQFLYIKIFSTAEELGEFVISSSIITNTEKELESKIGMTVSEWRDICKYAINDSIKGEIFKDILQKKLGEVY